MKEVEEFQPAFVPVIFGVVLCEDLFLWLVDL